MSYYTNGSVITGTATANSHVFSANSIYDPDVTGSGGTPMGFAKMMGLYSHYTVLKSKIVAILANTSNALLVNAIIYKSGTSTVLASFEQIMENGDVSFTSLAPSGVEGFQAKITQSCDARRYQGLDNILDDPDMRGDSASSPSEQQYYHVTVYNPYTATQVTVDFQVLIEFDVMFHEPKKAALG